MGIQEDHLIKFTDPNYWINYFPTEIQKDITNFGARIDFSRSFTTTEINPYFNSFVTWQFNKLISKGLVTYGKRYVIYSIKDNQPCADHDRSSGEGVNPKSYQTKVIELSFNNEKINLIAICRDKYELNELNTISFNPDEKYVVFEYQNKKYVVSEYAYKNILYQYENVKLMSDFNIDEFVKYNNIKIDNNIKSTGFIVNSPFEKNITSPYYEPEREVISRSGDICIVALTPQWFINYGDEKLTQQVNEFILNDFFSPDPAIKNQLISSSNWIKEWPCSRNYILGTKLPNTNLFIDSLSDSTIYMAYYTIAHLIKNVPLELLNDNIWDYIFDISDNIQNSSIIEYLKEMKNEFKYWYPVDLRVSGKDLVANHLTMCLYNHIAIWNKDYCPRSYSINGYQMLDGQKMSKHLGNFLTLRDAINKYGSDPLRLSLAECDGIDDADFRDEIANGNILKLSYEREWFLNMIDKLSSINFHEYQYKNNDNNIWDNILGNEIRMCMSKAYDHYKNFRFRKVVYDGFHVALSSRDKYIKLVNDNNINFGLIYKVMSSILLIIYPICPHFVEHIWNYGEEKKIIFTKIWEVNLMEISDEKYNYYKYYKDVINNIMNNVVGKKNFKIHIIRNYTSGENEMIKYYKDNDNDKIDLNDKNIWRKFVDDFIQKFIKNYKDIKYIINCRRFLSYIKLNVKIYGNVWFKCISEFEIQKEFIKKWVPILAKNKNTEFINIEFIEVDSDDSYQFKNGPGKPFIQE